MTTITHPELVSALCKPGTDIADDVNGDKDEKYLLLSQVNEFLDAGLELELTKKRVIYNKKDATIGKPSTYDFPHLTPKQAHLLHMAIGIAGEACELLEVVYNHILSGEDLNTENIIEESGDIEFYHEGFRQGVGITREEALSQNISKLSKRYQSLSYSDTAAQQRADKAEA